MNFNRLILPVWVLLVVCAGCQNQPTPKPDEGSSGNSTENSEPKTPQLEVPPSAKTEGFMYSGLDHTGTLGYSFKVEGQAEEPGEQTTALSLVKDGVATFTRSRSGKLAGMGEETVTASDKGVYVTNNSVGTMDKATLEMPADPKVGHTWDETVSMSANGQSMVQKAKYTILPITKLKVKAGEFDSLPIKMVGTLTPNGSKPQDIVATAWYVKSVGLAKMDMTTTINGKKSHLTIELTSVNK